MWHKNFCFVFGWLGKCNKQIEAWKFLIKNIGMFSYAQNKLIWAYNGAFFLRKWTCFYRKQGLFKIFVVAYVLMTHM